MATVVVFDTPGGFNWDVPALVTEVTVYAWGGGGGGNYDAPTGNGGGGGEFAMAVLTVEPGETASGEVGAAGLQAGGGEVGGPTDGGQSNISFPSIGGNSVEANGGKYTGPGGTTGVGDTTNDGGAGAAGGLTVAGGGGGGAGELAVGSPGVLGVGGAGGNSSGSPAELVDGGNGGNGATDAPLAATNPTAPGGGGGGGGTVADLPSNGEVGLVVIVYEAVASLTTEVGFEATPNGGSSTARLETNIEAGFFLYGTAGSTSAFGGIVVGDPKTLRRVAFLKTSLGMSEDDAGGSGSGPLGVRTTRINLGPSFTANALASLTTDLQLGQRIRAAINGDTGQVWSGGYKR